MLGWRPREFWRASVAEFFAAVAGWNRAQRGAAGTPEPTSQEDYDEIVAAEERRVARLRAADGE